MMKPSEENPYLYNRQGHTPFDEMDSLDLLELALIKEEQQERKGQKNMGQGEGEESVK